MIANFGAMPAVVFALWTLFVWGTRIRNADGAAGATALALTFVALAVAVLAWRTRRRQLVLVLAGWTTAAWAVRMVTIWIGDRSVAFKVVHTVLAVVSIALAAWALRSAQLDRIGDGANRRPRDERAAGRRLVPRR